jgi:hypothetical protein
MFRNRTATERYMNSSSLPFYTFRLYEERPVFLLAGGKYKDLEGTSGMFSIQSPSSWIQDTVRLVILLVCWCVHLNWTWGDRQEYNIERTGKWTTTDLPNPTYLKKNWQKKNPWRGGAIWETVSKLEFSK